MRYTGQYGFALSISHKGIRELIAELASEYPDSELPLDPFSNGSGMPHITLFHTWIEDAPREDVAAILKELRGMVIGLNATLCDVEVFGDAFVFWNAKRNEKLTALHEAALQLARWHVPGEDVKKEKLAIPQLQQENIKQYGHPLVKGEWLPHVTLAYKPGITLGNTHKCMQTARLDSVQLVRVGTFGLVAEVMDL